MIYTHAPDGCGYIFQGNNVLVPENHPEDLAPLDLAAFAGIIDGECCTENPSNITGRIITGAAAKNNVAAPQGYAFIPVRQAAFTGMLPQNTAADILRIKALYCWMQKTHYCGHCGAAMESSETETARFCPQCKDIVYPRISPAVITLVHNGSKILLARHLLRNQDVYTCIAGFVESGESLEAAVVREVKEETGITVTNVRYAGSQSWPFPDQLMAAFHADYLEGTIAVQKSEIAEAQWFDKNDNPATPPRGSVAWNLIFGTFKKTE